MQSVQQHQKNKVIYTKYDIFWIDTEYTRLSTADVDQVKSDVLPYIIDRRELDIWSNDYFLQLADLMVFE